MNIQQLRQSLKLKWLSYYEQNRSWLTKIRVWGTYGQLRRPSSGFILATLSVLEPQFEEILPFILDLNNNPDEIVTALGLNFNPDEELTLLKVEDSLVANHLESELSQEKHSEGELLTLLTPVEIQHSEKIPIELPNKHEAVPTLIATTEAAHPPTPVPLVAVATKSVVKTPHSVKSPPGFIRQNETVRYLVTNPIVQERQGRTGEAREALASKGKQATHSILHTRLTNAAPSPLGRFPSGTSLIITTEVSRNGQKRQGSRGQGAREKTETELVTPPKFERPRRAGLYTHVPPCSTALGRNCSPCSLLPAPPLLGKYLRPSGRLTSGVSLAITTDVPVTAKTLPSLALTNEIPNNSKAISTLTLAKKMQNNAQYINMQPSEISRKENMPTTNARSLASWVDEFCQGTRCDR